MRLVAISSILLWAAAGCVSAPRAGPPNGAREWGPCRTLVMLRDKRIDESSGICSSRRADGVYYTHNDSGDSARFFRFDRKGRILGVYEVANAYRAIDWEDIASATVGGKAYVFCGDIGDNAGNRKEVYVYRVPEPLRDGSQTVRADRIYVLNYPDGPHNAETLMVSPATGEITIVTKSPEHPSEVFVLAHPGASGHYTLRLAGSLKVGGAIRESRLITGGDVSPDSKHVVLRTYMDAWEYDVSADPETWFRGKPRRIQTNFEFGGEGICYSRDGRELLTTSEGSPCQVSEASLKG